MELYHCRIDAFSDMAGLALLDPARRARLEKSGSAAVRMRMLTAGLMLRYALGARVRDMEEGPHGKPFLPEGPCFNLSHSGEYVLLGLSAHELGVDVERIAALRGRVAERCFCEEELRFLYAQEDPQEAFYRLWTAKESVMKATGLGFSLSPASFCVLPLEDGAHSIHGQSWFLRWFSLPSCTICTACAADEDVIWRPLDRAVLLCATAD